MARAVRPRLLLSALYLADLAGVGAWLPFLAVALDRKGISGAGIGGLLAIIPVARMLSAPLWSLVADRTRSGRALLRLATGGSLLAAVALAALPLPPWGIGVLLLVFSTLRSPIAPLVDTTAVKIITDEGGDPQDYGRLRMWGTVGFLLGSAAGSMLMAASPLAGSALWLAVAAWTTSTALAFLLPAAPAAAPAPVWPALRRLAVSPFLGPLLLALCLHGMGLTVYDTTLAMHMEGLGLAGGWVATALTLGLLAEIAVMWWGRHLLRRLGPFRMLTVAGATGALRWGLTAVVTTPALLAGLQLLHGVVYAVFWLAGVEAMRRHAPEEVRVSAQSMLTTTAYGVGSLLSAAAVGALLEPLGTSGLFGAAALASLLATAGLLRAQHQAPR